MRVLVLAGALTLPLSSMAQVGRSAAAAIALERLQQSAVDAQKTMAEGLPYWETIPPRSKAECFEETGGVVNEAFVRCRNGRQEQVRVLRDGKRRVLQERPIPR